MSKFQIITLFIFIVAIVAGVAAFALYQGSGKNNALPPITIWGTFPAGAFNDYVSDINGTLPQSMNVTYVEKRPESFNKDFVNALALGQGPDAILIPADMLLSEKNKLTVVPWSALSQRDYLNSYVGGAKVYLSESDGGAWAIPFTIDPLIMYWNRDIFSVAGLALPPIFWDEFTGTSAKPGLVQKLIVKDQNGNISRAALAMGDFTNMNNARQLLGSLFLQLGNPITSADKDGFVYSAISGSETNISTAPALQFFSQFVNPAASNYSWNRAMPNDKTAFLAGKVATYFGLASELLEIRSKNPNLNYDAAPLPQFRNGQKAVYGQIYGFSLVRNSTKANTAFQVISTLVLPYNLANLEKTIYLPSVRNDLIAIGSDDPYITVFNKEALIAKTWLDIDPNLSDQIFGNMVQSVVSGQKTIDQAITDTNYQYDAALKQAGQ